MPHCAEEKTGLCTHGLQKMRSSWATGGLSIKMAAQTHTCSFLIHSQKGQKVYITKRGAQQGSKLKTPERKPSLELGWVGGVTTETQHPLRAEVKSDRCVGG